MRHLRLFPALLATACTALPASDSPIPDRMVAIPAASFEMGTDSSEIPWLLQRFRTDRAAFFTPEMPRHGVDLKAYLIDRFEVTNSEFQDFVDARPEWHPANIPSDLHNGAYLAHWDGGREPSELADHPVVNITWGAAEAFCRWRGKRLPTEAEWEHAARGGLSGEVFPWGTADPDASIVNWGRSGLDAPVAVGRYPANGFGLYDMAGNVWEFVNDPWRDTYAAESTHEGTSDRYVVRGGSYGAAAINLRVRFRDSHPALGAGPHVGFRCAAESPGRGD